MQMEVPLGKGFDLKFEIADLNKDTNLLLEQIISGQEELNKNLTAVLQVA
jgi:hypothetical protein